MVGSQRSEVFAVLEQSRTKTWPVPVSIGDTGKELVVEAGAGEGLLEFRFDGLRLRQRQAAAVAAGAA